MNLRDFFPVEEVVRDSEFRSTLHPDAETSGALCYGMQEAALLRINRNPRVTAVITTSGLADLVSPEIGVVVSADPQRSYYDLHNRLVDEDRVPLHTAESVDPSARIATTAVIGRRVIVGADVTIAHGVVLGDYTIVGDGTTVAEYAVIGARGMQNLKVQGHFYPVRWAGGVRIGKQCEILTGAVVQRPYHAEYTDVGDEVRISVRANVGHRSVIGARTMIGGSCQIGGNASIGSDVWIGQGSTLTDGIRVGDRAEVKMGSVVVRDVPAGEAVSGAFALPHELNIAAFTRARRG
jgi:UDP-3-O-[3-hydroxymyristoyl] glucosamine N-acyltransferase